MRRCCWRRWSVMLLLTLLAVRVCDGTAIFDPHKEERQEFLRPRRLLDDRCKSVTLEIGGHPYYAHCFEADGTYIYQGDFVGVDKSVPLEPQKGYGITPQEALARLIEHVKSRIRN